MLTKGLVEKCMGPHLIADFDADPSGPDEHPLDTVTDESACGAETRG